MRKDWKYILYISLAFGVFILLKLLSPKQYDWNITYAHEDKNPYGWYALNELLPTSFKGREITHSYQTLYEIKDSLERKGNFISIGSNFNGDEADTKALLKHIAAGGSAIISANYFMGFIQDTPKISTEDYIFKEGNVLSREDTATIKLVNTGFSHHNIFYFKRDDIHNYFSRFDSTKTTVIARNDKNQPVTIRMAIGKGTLILNCTPLAFTNIYILSKENYQFISSMLSYLPPTDIEWTEYYHLGRMEVQSELRFILKNEALAWAYYVTIFAILFFMVFEMKRRQRIIPIMIPFQNTTLEFVRTIGNLYFQSGEHKAVADKKINFFFDHLRTKYWITATTIDEHFIQTVSKKTGKPEVNIRALLNIIRFIQSQEHIAVDRLIDLNEQLELFYDYEKK